MRNKSEDVLGKKKIGVMPTLRFDCFKKEWEFAPLSQFASRSTRRNSDEQERRVLTNSAERGIIDQREYFDKNIADQSNLHGYYIVEKGDFVYNPRVSSAAPVGPISQNEIGTGVMSPLYTVFRFFSSETSFFSQFFKSRAWHDYLQRISSIGARHDRMSIGVDAFMNMPVPNIDIHEQKKIADCLCSLDDCIGAEIRKIDALKAQKHGLMQQLFPAEGQGLPSMRFPEFAEHWDEVALSSQVELISGQHLAPGQYSIDGEIPYFTGPSDYVNSLNSVAKWTASTKNKGCKGDILITVKGSGVGELLHLTLEEVAIGRQLMAVRPIEADGKFLFQFFLMQRQRLVSLSAGNLIPGLSRGDLLGLKIVLPKREEQEKIGEFLSAIDTLIDKVSFKVNMLQQHKRGLMHGLFPAMDTRAS